MHDFHKTYHLPSSIVFSFPPGVACSPARLGCRVVFSSSHPRWHPSSISCLVSSICLHTAGPLYLRYELAMSLAANDLPQHVATPLPRTTNKHRIGPQKCCQDNYIYTGMFPVGDTSSGTLIAVCVCVCVCVSADISLYCAKNDSTDYPEIVWLCWV